MSCPREHELALYVEDDLPLDEVRELQSHVLDCVICRSFLLSLEASQRALKELAAEPIANEALAVLRSRAEALPATASRSVRLGWALAAAVGLALLPGLYLAIQGPHGPSAPDVREVRTAPAVVAPPEAPQRPVATPEPAVAPRRASTPRPAAPGVAPDAALSPQDMDQLARALVAVSKIDRIRPLPEVEIDPDPADSIPVSGPMVQVATDDPNVVIYWRLEGNGGK